MEIIIPNLFVENGPPCPSLRKLPLLTGLSGVELRSIHMGYSSWNKWSEMDEWLERGGSSRHSYGQSNGRQGMSVLRVTPTPLFIIFS